MIEDSEVLKIANLSKLAFSGEDFGNMRSDMENFTKFTDAVSLYSASEAQNCFLKSEKSDFRVDMPKCSICADDVLKNTPTAENNFFKIRGNGADARKNQKIK